MAAFDSRIVVLGLRIAQAFLAVIILGLSGYGLSPPPPQTPPPGRDTSTFRH